MKSMQLKHVQEQGIKLWVCFPITVHMLFLQPLANKHTLYLFIVTCCETSRFLFSRTL